MRAGFVSRRFVLKNTVSPILVHTGKMQFSLFLRGSRPCALHDRTTTRHLSSSNSIFDQAKQAFDKTVQSSSTLSKQMTDAAAAAVSKVSGETAAQILDKTKAVAASTSETAAQILDKARSATASTTEAAAKAFESSKKTVQEGASAAANTVGSVAQAATKPVTNAVESVCATGRRVRRMMILCGALATVLAIGYVAKPWAPMVHDMYKRRQEQQAKAIAATDKDKDKDKKS